jgi:hypothetical protein
LYVNFRCFLPGYYRAGGGSSFLEKCVIICHTVWRHSAVQGAFKIIAVRITRYKIVILESCCVHFLERGHKRNTWHRDPGSIPGTTKKKVVSLERGPLGVVSTTEELLDRKVAAPVQKTENTA